ncbi:calaxin isoform X2 [Phascolarctos cinereus]|uniref:EF-hand calcium-binding domain-containing protein 1 isoform X3 n=1 Tax=Phascolarctos cinereus TaxID=38626 RepID=A0A6P5KT87_PHACI|nr:EF-hand calcium-binding domain-containing protein 1 isoform X3 [Phascolarctos cinereus]
MYTATRKRLQKLTDSTSKASKHFNRYEIECLIKLFYTLLEETTEKQSSIGIDRNAFRNFLHTTFGMTDDMIMDRVFRAFDKDNDGIVNVTEWISGLCIFLRGNLEERTKYCFEVYDLNGDGFISREEMFHMLKNSLLKQPSEEDPDEGIKDLVDITLKKMDHDHDGKLSFADYETSVQEEALLLEAFGPCLPDAKLLKKLFNPKKKVPKGTMRHHSGTRSHLEFEAQVFKDPHDL